MDESQQVTEPLGENADDDSGGRTRRGPRWPLWTGAGLVGLLLAGTGASFAFANTTSEDSIALGTSVAGVDIGGMTVPQATATLEEERVRLRKVVVSWADERYTFDPREAGIGIDPAASAQAAHDATSGGSAINRTINMYLGHEVAPQLQQDRSSIIAFVQSLPQDLSGLPVNAQVEGIPGQKLKVTASEDQTGLDASRLEQDLGDALVRTGAKQKVQAHRGVVVEADLTTRELKQAVNGDEFLYVDQRAEGPLQHQSVSRYSNGEFVESYPVSTGQASWPTNVGLTAIESHIECPAWVQGNSSWFPNPGSSVAGCTPGNPLGRYWLGIGDGEGFHVGSVYVLSHGCIHMNEPDIKTLYDELPNGTPVYVGPL